MPPKGAEKTPVETARTEHSDPDPSQSPPRDSTPAVTAAAPQAPPKLLTKNADRKRVRVTVAKTTIAAARVEVEVDSSVATVSSEASTAISVDDDTGSASVDGAPRPRQRQTTLTGEIVDTSEKAIKEARAKARKSDATATPRNETTTGGELKPSSPPARANSVKKLSGDSAAVSAHAVVAVTTDPKIAPVLEKALLAHMRNALTFYAVTRSRRTIGLTTTPTAAQKADAIDSIAAAEEDAVSWPTRGEAVSPDGELVPKYTDEDENEAKEREEEGEASVKAGKTTKASKEATEHTKSADDTQAFLALPCVQYFILNECARIARVVREEGGEGYGDNPGQRALELLGLFISMLETPGSFATLLVLACPSCRSIGISADTLSKVMEFLVLSQRVKREKLFALDQTKGFEVLGLLDGCRDDAGRPVEPFHCCPYGEAHIDLQLTLIGWAHSQRAAHNCHLKCGFVPFQIEEFPAIVEAAKRYYRAYEEHTTLLMRQWNEQQVNQQANAAAKAIRRKNANPPQLYKATLILIRDRADNRSWAEDLFYKVFPGAPIVMDTQPLRCSVLQAHIRAAYVYTQADVLGRGGYFNITLHTPTSHFRAQCVRTHFTEAEIVFLPHLFTFMKVCQHIAEAMPHRNDTSSDHLQCCLCHTSTTPSSPSFLLVEEHIPHLAALRRCREEQYLLVNETEERAEAALCNSQAAYNVDDEEEETKAVWRNSVGGGISYYAAGSFSRFHTTLDLTGHMNANQVVDYVARATAEAAEALPASAVPAAYIHAQLKRHQLEDVQWMWSKETEGYREHVQVPLYRVSFHGPEVRCRPLAQRTGTMSYCATTKEMVVEFGTGKWCASGRCIRGGLLCDDVGLGKTLTILTLCAYDRAMQEAGAAATDEEEAAAAAATPCANRFWQVSARCWVARTQTLQFNTNVLRWGFGAGTFHAGTTPHTDPLTRLPRTTLVVVPLSIASQWIEELHKFYPSATYILFYGVKRTQYTVADLLRADFVLTTYETLSTHLRNETDGLRYWLARTADAADDAACVSAAVQGWPACRPSHLRAALGTFASTAVWPQLPNEADPLFIDFYRRRGYTLQVCNNIAGAASAPPNQRSRSGRRESADGSSQQQHQQQQPPPQLDAWKFKLNNATGYPSFYCPAFSIFVTATSDVVANDNAELAPARLAVYRRLCSSRGSTVSNVFLDDVWELLRTYSDAVNATPEWTSYSLQSGLFDFAVGEHTTENFLALLFRSEKRYPMTDTIRRLFVRHVLLPSLWQPMQQYWAHMQPHYAAVASAELTGRMPLRILDLLFHRVVLDESQKCGASSLFHLLQGDRRWALTGTPLNNNKTESLGAALAFLGMDSAARLLSQAPQRSIHFTNNWIARHDRALNSFLRMFFSRVINRTDTRFRARLHLPFESNRVYQDTQICFCAACAQSTVYGVAEGTNDAVIPLECRRRETHRQYPGGLPCLPNALMEILAVAMVRHERNQQVSRELQLPPVRYCAHRADFTEDEMTLYDRVARVVMQVASRLHRQGLLSSRMGHAMQWVQELCRLCLHPSRVGNAELLRGDTEAHILRAVHLTNNDTSHDTADFAASVAATFVTVTAQEALEWVRSVAHGSTEHAQTLYGPLHPTACGHNAHGVPEETVSALHDLAANPPLLPLCGVCMDDMIAPTLLNCFHMFCKECLIGVIDASRSFVGHVNAKCPYCRDRKSLLEEKRVIIVGRAETVNEEPAPSKETKAGGQQSDTLTANNIDAIMARIGDGSRVRAFVGLVRQIWASKPGDGVLVFSKYPAFLQLAHDSIQAAGYTPYMVRGASTLVQRQRIMRALQQPGGASPVPHRILFVTSRSANAGLNLTFANHVIFLEPNLNPAMEQQAVGRVHRFGQLKQVMVHHFYAPRTIEEIIYHRSVRLRDQAAELQWTAEIAAEMQTAVQNVNEMQRRTQFGRIAPSEISLLLEYPVPPQQR